MPATPLSVPSQLSLLTAGEALGTMVPSEFSGIESSVVPGDEQSSQNIRETIVRLQEKLLGYKLPLDHPEVDRVFEFFSGIIRDAKALPTIEPRETYFCGGREDFQVEDPHYTVRGWRGVVTSITPT